MPRKAFIADLKTATESAIAGIGSVVKGDDDGSVYATFVPDSGQPIEIELMVQPDVGSYPEESFYMIFSKSVIIPDGVGDILGSVAESSMGASMTLSNVLVDISQKLQRHLVGDKHLNPSVAESHVDPMDMDSEQEGVASESESDEFFGASDHDDFDIGGVLGGKTLSTATFSLGPEQIAKINHRIREDLRAMHFAGFKIGVLVGMKADTIQNLLSISVQITKLGLSEEAMQAWDLEPEQYIILLIRYSNGYKDFDTIIDDPVSSLDMTYRVGVGNSYKPSIQEALAAFIDIPKDEKKYSQDLTTDQDHGELPSAGFSNMFISSSLNELINARFVSLLKIRNSVGVGWDGAKKYFNDHEGRINLTAELPQEICVDTPPTNTTLPLFVTADHLVEKGTNHISFPLIAAQFTLRYLTRCTEFCLVCHDKIKEDFEALKPYVCEKPLCLYQYMNLGFGPSVEHEVLTQPYVVDLLVSFCYSAARNRRIREYPVGMSLAVPEILTYSTVPIQRHVINRAVVEEVDPLPKPRDEIIVRFDSARHEVLFEEHNSSPVRRGDWVILTATTQQHFRVEDVSLFPTVKLCKSAILRTSTPEVEGPPLVTTPDTPSVTPQPPNFSVAKLSIYNKNFDDMEDRDKAETIVMLIETMPTIGEMRTHLLKQSRLSQPSLRSWSERISPAALGMLRWIIASNRSCIVQVDKCPGQSESELALAKVRLEQRVSNISTDWVQFRFAQGSPDKEQRFLNALREEQNNLDVKYPTLFAFHGSAIHNWHSIIRSGLDFKETLHGRAFGHGVYHAPDQITSVGYTASQTTFWHGSLPQITSAMSLNEIVNCPDKYASKNPHLVVQFIDWIQCRYLLVQTQNGATSGLNYRGYSTSGVASRESEPEVEVEQHPSYQAKSTLGQVVGVPLCAASISRSFIETVTTEQSHKRRKSTHSSMFHQATENLISDTEDPQDLAFLLSDDEVNIPAPIVFSAPKSSLSSLTDFAPGSLDQSKLPMLKEPEYATTMATKALNRALKEVLEVQKKTPLDELGWYIDAEVIDNVYQWIVELHSFDAELPLSKDMKNAGITSIVLEIRFPKDYPFSPPFLRVIRPRFLPFTMGGGGHVTGGGAMCMELLTTSGWSAVSSIEGVLLQVRLAISNLEPRPARLEGKGARQAVTDYSVGEAMAAYIRACNAHDWKVPESFKDFASGSDAGMF